ncbi:MAG TPA: ABC transporter permease [Vicinamibacterales bacterium]|nr:ABC transporter permease [Vicinamibacterales bacterium]
MLDFLRLAASRVRSALSLTRVDAEFQKELASHLDLATAENIRRGMAPDEARRQARIRLGGVAQLREDNRGLHGLPFLAAAVQDVRYGWRVLRKSPGFAITAVLTLALAIGANAVVFAALNAFILRPLNVPHPESLYSIHRIGDDAANQSYPDYVDLRDRNRSFEDLAAYTWAFIGVDAGTSPMRAWGVAASGNYFDVLGIQPHLGRVFHAADEHGPNSAPYVVLGYGYWHAHFHDDPAIVGRTVRLNTHPFTVIGVAPAEFRGTLLLFNPDFFVPLVNVEQIQSAIGLNDRGNRDAVFMTLGHLKAGVTPAQAAADVDAIWADVVKTYPANHRASTFALGRPSLYGEHLGRPFRTFLSALMLLAGLILVAACANLGSVFTARAADRAGEVALRLALGAGRLRIVRQFLTEALLLSAAGTALGLWGAVRLLQVLRAWQPFPQYPVNVPLTPDATVYAVAVLMAFVSGLLFGAAPVRQLLRTDAYATMKAGLRYTAGPRLALRDVLVIVQIAICAVLVTSSLVAVRGLARSLNSGLGFDPRNVMLVNTPIEMAGYHDDQVPAFQKRSLEAMAALPDVVSVAIVNAIPLTGGVEEDRIFRGEATDLRPANAAATASILKISPEYLHTAGTTLLAGREFTWHDDTGAPRVAVINAEFARRMFGSVAAAPGRYFRLQNGTQIEVVGVAEDGKYDALTEDPRPAVFLPIVQFPSNDAWLVIRSAGNTPQRAAAIEGKLRELDPALPALIQTWDGAMTIPLFPARMAAAALGVLGLMGAMLAVTGIFGIAACSVSQRLKEFGIRMALGAQPMQVLRSSLARPLRLLMLGSVAGLVLGVVISRVLEFLVYEANPRDPVVLAGAVLAMSALGIVATWIPARRALSLDPLTLLRDE